MTEVYEVQLNSQGAPNFATAQKVVRCADCKYCDSFIKARSADGLTELMEYRCKDFHASVMPDEYCSRGERRDEAR